MQEQFEQVLRFLREQREEERQHAIMAQVWAESFAEKENAKAAPRRGCGSDSSTTAAAGRGPAHLHDRRHAPRDLLRALPLDRLHRAALHGWIRQGEATLGRSDSALSHPRPTSLGLSFGMRGVLA